MKHLLSMLLSAAVFAGGAAIGQAKEPATPHPSKTSSSLDGKSIYQIDGTWSDDNGKPFKLTSLLGHPVVLVMFFTQCEVSCPIVVEQLKTLRGELPKPVRETTRFVLVSMDVARDDDQALRGFRATKNLKGDGWILLRGDDEEVTELAMLLGMKFKQDTRGQFAHSNIVTVLDKKGVVSYQRIGLNVDNGPAVAALTTLSSAAR